MPSQFADKDSWMARYLSDVPEGDDERRDFILEFLKQMDVEVADRYRERLIEIYGAERGRAARYAEAFELCQYGSQVAFKELKEMFLFD